MSNRLEGNQASKQFNNHSRGVRLRHFKHSISFIPKHASITPHYCSLWLLGEERLREARGLPWRCAAL